MREFPTNQVSAETVIAIRTDLLTLGALEEFVRSCRANGIPGDTRIHTTRNMGSKHGSLQAIVDIPSDPDPEWGPEARLEPELLGGPFPAGTTAETLRAPEASEDQSPMQEITSAALTELSTWWWKDDTQYWLTTEGIHQTLSGIGRLSIHEGLDRGWTRITESQAPYK